VKYNFSVIGGGVVGLATARAILKTHPHAKVVVLEKEKEAGLHQSTHNSGVLHAGLYYKPGSLKARMAVSGIRMMTSYCVEKGIPHEICGKLVIATDEQEVAILRNLHQRGLENGLSGLKWLDSSELREREPHAAGVAALLVPEEGIVDYKAVCAEFVKDIREMGGEFCSGARVDAIHRKGSEWILETTAGKFQCDYLINCAGLFSDRVAELAGVKRDIRIIPFRGEYYKLGPGAAHLVKNLIYPVPDPKFPFLGVHFTRLIHGGIEAGPNAVLALAREAYTKSDFSIRDMTDTLSFSGFWKFMMQHKRMCLGEVIRSFSRDLFAKSLQKLVPEVHARDLEVGGAGVRAQAMSSDGTLVNDFCLVEKLGAIHVLNAPSPGATASLAIAEEILQRFSITKNKRILK
jgi:L-2-hydroxyglutarate oxidase